MKGHDTCRHMAITITDIHCLTLPNIDIHYVKGSNN